MIAASCLHARFKRHGKNRNGSQRFRCLDCGYTWTEDRPRPIGDMRVDLDKAVFALRLLLEDMSIRATERLTGLHRDTLCSLVVTVGQRCKAWLSRTIRNVEVRDVQADELWGFIQCKERTRERLGKDDEHGDCYCFVAMERHTKLVLAWHVGKRTPETTWEFADNLRFATNGRFQLSTDGFLPYRTAIPGIFKSEIDHGTLVKQYGPSEDVQAARRYSPAAIIGIDKHAASGTPNMDRVCTSHIERENLTIRMQVRRLTRLTNAFSKKWENHEAMLGLFFAWYNFCRKHSTIKTTPAVAQGLTDHVWTLEELLTATTL